MKISTNPKKIHELLTRAVDTIYPTAADLEKSLKSGKRLRVYHGVDPTGPQLHIGHSIPLKNLRRFQELGHETILLIGSFTATIGDPTGKDASRKPLTREQVMENARTYKKQAAKILDFDGANATQVRFNHEWLDPMTLRDFIKLGFYVTGPRLLERDMFQRRLASGGTFTVTEELYPLLQGYDSVAMDVDVELGGTDQTFNMLMGRDLVGSLKKKEKFVITNPLVSDASGRKIGKSEGNVIGITDAPEDLYGKIMALGDEVIIPTFRLCTDLSMDEVREMERAMKAGANPRDYKARLAETIVEMYHGKKAADTAAKNFVKLFREHAAPEEMTEIKLKAEKWNVVELLVETKLAASKSDARRLLEQGGVKIDGHTLEGTDVEVIITKAGHVLQRGKRQFVRIRV